jgi:hypothetical protein
MTLELPEPHINQQAILDSSARFKVVLCGRRWGKSELCQIETVTRALNGEYVAYITPTYKLAKVFFDKLTNLLPFPANRSDLTITFPTGGSIDFFTGERLDNLRGRKFHQVILDEAPLIKDLQEGWNNSIRPTLTDFRGGALFASTPRGKEFFYSLYLKGKGGAEDWQSWKYSTYDNPYIDPREVDDARGQLPAAVFEQEYLANPMENAANPFGSAYIRSCIAPLSSKPVQFYGIDLAKSFDYTVIIGLDQDGMVCYYDRFQRDWRQTKETILQLDRSKPVFIDSTGVGDAITEDLQRSFQFMEGYKYTAQSKQQLMELLAHSIQHNAVKFPAGTIQEELEIFEYVYTSTGVKYSAPSGFHDDTVNALALAVKCRDKMKLKGQYIII